MRPWSQKPDRASKISMASCTKRAGTYLYASLVLVVCLVASNITLFIHVCMLPVNVL
jgi:hypothetical protein